MWTCETYIGHHCYIMWIFKNVFDYTLRFDHAQGMTTYIELKTQREDISLNLNPQNLPLRSLVKSINPFELYCCYPITVTHTVSAPGWQRLGESIIPVCK